MYKIISHSSNKKIYIIILLSSIVVELVYALRLNVWYGPYLNSTEIYIHI